MKSARCHSLLVAILVAFIPGMFTACGGGNSSMSDPASGGVVPASKHVVLLVEENQGYNSVVGNTGGWPHLNAMLSKGALAANYYADVHPSIGNYFALTTGVAVTTDDNSTTVQNVDSIARRMLTDNVPFKVYAEGITQGYLGGDKGLYVIRHNPFALLSDIAASNQVANTVLWPFTQFGADAGKNALPPFSFIVPDINDDAHSASVQQADAWLQANVIAALSGNPAFQPGGDGILAVVFDESSSTDTAHGGGHVVAAFWGPKVTPGYVQTSSTIYQHESMLRTIMEALQLPNPPGAAAAAPDMAEFFIQK